MCIRTKWFEVIRFANDFLPSGDQNVVFFGTLGCVVFSTCVSHCKCNFLFSLNFLAFESSVRKLDKHRKNFEFGISWAFMELISCKIVNEMTYSVIHRYRHWNINEIWLCLRDYNKNNYLMAQLMPRAFDWISALFPTITGSYKQTFHETHWNTYREITIRHKLTDLLCRMVLSVRNEQFEI